MVNPALILSYFMEDFANSDTELDAKYVKDFFYYFGVLLGLFGAFMTVLINFVIAGFLGSGIPILLNHFDIDPAAASGVFLTACTDAIGFFSFLVLAYFFLV